MTVPRNIFTCADYPDPAVIADLHSQTVCAALLCRALLEVNRLCSSTLSVNCEKAEKVTLRQPDCRSYFSKRSPLSGLRQAMKQRER